MWIRRRPRSIAMITLIIAVATVSLLLADRSAMTVPHPRRNPATAIVFTSRTETASLRPEAPESEPYREPVQVPWAAREGRLRLLDGDGRLHELSWGRRLPDGSTLIDVMSPSVSLDGGRILFAGRKGGADRWRIYEIRVDGSGLKQLTGGPGTLAPAGWPSISSPTLPGQPTSTWKPSAIFARSSPAISPASPMHRRRAWPCRVARCRPPRSPCSSRTRITHRPSGSVGGTTRPRSRGSTCRAPSIIEAGSRRRSPDPRSRVRRRRRGGQVRRAPMRPTDAPARGQRAAARPWIVRIAPRTSRLVE
jgi:hypothetical protein